MRIVIDCNVLIAANARKTHVSSECSAAAGRWLGEVIESHTMLDDLDDLAFHEYKTHCNFKGQPGVGDRFFRWYILNRAVEDKVDRINIGLTHEDHRAKIPTALHSFDPSDLKWIALYCRGSGDAIIQAGDSDYEEHGAELSSEKINVHNLC